MKLVSAVGGVTAIRVPTDDFNPTGGFLAHEIQGALIERYKAEAYPVPFQQQIQTPAGLTPNPASPKVWVQNGYIEHLGAKIPLHHIVLFQNGLWVSTQTNTEHADIVMDDLTSLLGSKFGFKIVENSPTRLHISSIVVEFDGALEKLSSDLERVSSVINGAISSAAPLQFRRIVFGCEGHEELVYSFDNLEWGHFLIERRAESPYSKNRFYCSAPMTTSAHYSTLEAIERALQD